MKDESMKNLRSVLQEADPLAREPGLSSGDAERMRHAIVNASRDQVSVHVSWLRALAAVAVLVLMVVAGTRGVRDFSSRASESRAGRAQTNAASAAGAADTSERRQVQFSTPGGTRIIWTLDPQFKLEGVVP
jgi:hypothetical protein